MKTGLFVVAAAVATLGAYSSQRVSPTASIGTNQIGKNLFPEFTDPKQARSMKIVSYDDKLGMMRKFEVAQKNGAWVIPSHEDYPADAAENLAAAATLLVDLKIVSMESDKKQDHVKFGVLEPKTDSTEVGATGVGKMVTFDDAKGEQLAGLVIGTAVAGQTDQRFVRVPGRDQIYVVKIDPTKLSTRFEDWIKTDLLEVAGFDISEMEIHDYSTNPVMADRGLELELEPRFEATATWNDKDFRWELGGLREFEDGKYEEVALAEGEELNKEKLDDMKSALDDLKIADVLKKPEGLRPSGTDEKNILGDRESLMSLVEHGFYPVPDAQDPKSIKLHCSDGEVVVRTKDGVELKLWFGAQAATLKESGGGQLNRYVMVSASANPAVFTKPEPPPATDPAATSDPATPPAPDATSAAAPPDAQATRDAELKEYERKLNEYNEQVKKATDKALDLNFRLGQWYYVVSEEVYNRIHLNRGDFIKTTPAAAALRNDVEALRSLESEGLRKNP